MQTSTDEDLCQIQTITVTIHIHQCYQCPHSCSHRVTVKTDHYSSVLSMTENVIFRDLHLQLTTQKGSLRRGEGDGGVKGGTWTDVFLISLILLQNVGVN